MPTSRARVRRRRPAFALIAVLLLTALALVCAFGALKATASFERENENLVALGCARSAALAGAKIALADLQTYTGTDACATAKIVPSASASEWLGAWHGKRIRQEFSSGAVPLVSARGVFAGTRSCFLRDAARMSAPAEVPWEKLGENVRFAYFILDESLRASAARREREAHLRRFGGDPETLARLRRQVPRNTHFAHFLDGGRRILSHRSLLTQPRNLRVRALQPLAEILRFDTPTLQSSGKLRRLIRVFRNGRHAVTISLILAPQTLAGLRSPLEHSLIIVPFLRNGAQLARKTNYLAALI